MSETGSTASTSSRQELPPHPVGSAGETYLATLGPQGRELHELATTMLGSSYFVERTHGFRKWMAVAAKAAATAGAAAAKK
jgi:hypothetical protein